MLNLSEISKIGVGTYRMSNKNQEHADALCYALNSGVNLIDTSSNYLFGESEKLIGEITSNFNRDDMFLITKAGYLQGPDLDKFSKFAKSKSSVQINESFCYSIDRKFIEFQVYESLKRLRFNYIDGFLLHNPEYLLNRYDDKNELDKLLLDTLFYLENLVESGVIRYYGISSNTITKPTEPRGIDVSNIMNNLNNLPNFKLLQFPFNMNENHANEKTFKGKSLLEICQDNEIQSFGNRPLNTSQNGKVARIADYSKETFLLNEQKEEKLFEDLKSVIRTKLNDLGEDAALDQFSPIKFFIENKKRIANPKAVDQAINKLLLPFLSQLGIKNEEIKLILKELRNFWILYSKKYITEQSRRMRLEWQRHKFVSKDDSRDISAIVCNHYLNQGLDHCLVGMRTKNYVKKILDL